MSVYRIVYMGERVGVIDRATISPYFSNAADASLSSPQYRGAVLVDGKRAAIAEAFKSATTVIACGQLVARPRS